jgi:hypothetical protein
VHLANGPRWRVERSGEDLRRSVATRVLQGNGFGRGIGSEDRGRGTSPRLRRKRIDRRDEARVCEACSWNRNKAKERCGRKPRSASSETCRVALARFGNEAKVEKERDLQRCGRKANRQEARTATENVLAHGAQSGAQRSRAVHGTTERADRQEARTAARNEPAMDGQRARASVIERARQPGGSSGATTVRIFEKRDNDAARELVPRDRRR